MNPCACGSDLAYASCCGRFLDGQQLASTPEELMRSRYTAFTLSNVGYLTRTMKSPAADGFEPSSVLESAKEIKWDWLIIIKSHGNDKIGFVEFKACYTIDHTQRVIHELSEFHFEDMQWFYVNGERNPIAIKVGRNDVCPCGSGRKYKKCCA